MPQRRHHLHMKRYNDCFTGAEAVDWLLKKLNPVGLLKDGGQLSQEQAVKILELCVKFDVIEDVRGSDSTMTNFRGDRKHLYRFVTERPSLFGDNITGSTSSYTSSDTAKDTNSDTARDTSHVSTKDSSMESSLCIGNKHFWQSPAVRSMSRVSLGSATKTPTGRKRKRALSEIDMNQINGKPSTTLTHIDVAKIWQEHIIAR